MGVRFRFTATWAIALLGCGIAAAAIGCGGSGAVPGHGLPPGSTPPPAPVRDDWPMYAHDARHTSASAASIPGALKVAWRYDPQPLSGNSFGGMFGEVATSTGGVYVHFSQYGATVFAGGPSVDGVSTSGAKTWDYVEHRDYDEGHWPSIFNGGVVLQDDGEELLDVITGKVIKTLASSFDVWGETIPDTTGLYGANIFIADGPNLFVYAFNSSNVIQWKALQQTGTKYSNDNNGGLLLSNGVLFYAASYSDPVPNASGIYALNASTGVQTGHVATTPVSEMSADATNLYVVEQGSSLVARAQSNLGIVWSVNIASTSTSAPVMADGLVIVQTASGIEAHNAGTGKTTWTSPVSPAFAGGYSSAMCAALVSNTLILTAFDGLHVLNLANGTEIWHGTVSGAMGTAVNPIIVNDPARGATVYVTDNRGVIALVPQ